MLSSRLGTASCRGDGVVAGVGRVGGRAVACYAQDPSFVVGTLGAAHAETIRRVGQLAARARLPLVSFVESGGARLQEGTAALAGFGRVFRQNVTLSTLVPQISIVAGPSAGGGCYSPALTDFVVMTSRAAMFLTGPAVVREAIGQRVCPAELGGPGLHERNGVCDLVVADDGSAAASARSILGYLPQHFGMPPPIWPGRDPEAGDPGAAVPASGRKVYDMREVLRGIVDAGSLLELAPRWARNMLTGFARLEGRPVGVVANQPRHLGGVIDSEGARKAARFVSRCDRFGLPLVVLVDTPGFLPGVEQERAGVIRSGAELVRAFAAATVPRLTVVVRKAYGGAFIAMNCRDLGADLVFAWPGAEIGLMSGHAAAAVMNRRQLAVAPDPRDTHRLLADAYVREHLSADSAAAGGFIDELVESSQTRSRLIWALSSLAA